MASLAIDNTDMLAKMNEEHQRKTKEMTKEHNQKMEHINAKISSTKKVIEMMQDDHDELFKRMKKEYETEKTELEDDLRRKKQKLLVDLFQINQDRREMDEVFESKDKEMELKCVDDYLKMNWRNEKGSLMRNPGIGEDQEGEERTRRSCKEEI